jgi:uncharacterized protein YecE (DUF72 family)
MRPTKETPQGPRRLWIGTSGYSYDDWGGVFYPEGLPQRDRFEFYASQFRVVELNVTFYRLPRPEIFEGWNRRAPEPFLFFVKGSKYITHLQMLRDPAPSLKKFFDAAGSLGRRLAGVLWQFPPNFSPQPERLEAFLEALKAHPSTRHVFEFRDPGWFTTETAGLLEKAGAAFCRADQPEFCKTLDIPDTAPFVYLRRHGPETGRRYRFSYGDDALKSDAEEVKRWLAAGKDVFIFFNNDVGGAAPADARRLESLLAPLDVKEKKKVA